jgi:purine-binding chemotaxis protein CheW
MISEIPMDESHEELLKERARILAKTGEEEIAGEEGVRLLAFSLAEEQFGLNLDYVQEIQPLKRDMWSRVPCTPDFIIGAVNIRGRIYSIMNIAAYLEIGMELNMEKAHVLLIKGEVDVDRNPMEFCILTEDRPRLEYVLPDAIQPATGTLSAKGQEFIRGVTAEMLMILDLKKLISHPGIIINDETN